MAQLDIQQARQPDPGQRPGPGLEWVDPTARIGATDERADRGTADDVRLDPDASEGPEHADVRPATGDAAAQSDAKAQSGGRIGSQGLIRPRGCGDPHPIVEHLAEALGRREIIRSTGTAQAIHE